MKDVSWYFHFTIFQNFKYKLKEYRGKKLITKELNTCLKLQFSHHYNFQTIHSARSNKKVLFEASVHTSWLLRNTFLFFKMSGVFSRNVYFLIPIFFQPDGVNMWYFQLGLSEIYKVHDTGIIKSEFQRLNSFVPKLSFEICYSL